MKTTNQTQSDPIGWINANWAFKDRDLQRWPYLPVFQKLALALGLLVDPMVNRTQSVPWNPGYVAVTHKIT